MVKTIKGDLILTEDTSFDEDLKVEGDIRGYYDLKVAGDIDARNIDAWDIVARNIDAWDIDAWDIDARNIDAWNIDAGNIDARNIVAGNIVYCETVKVKLKIRAKALIKNRSRLKITEW